MLSGFVRKITTHSTIMTILSGFKGDRRHIILKWQLGMFHYKKKRKFDLSFWTCFKSVETGKLRKREENGKKKKLNGLSPTCHQVIAQTIYNGRA